ncbi:hypothetical protein GCM10022224_080200 [Nonomuraea antimicrobica]|uniref:Uncharacterized protein n=1 Tax=Nonomuraea antimicrobica TaxID=561173 RepID=A0ABP7DCQ6_9ACTN
MAETPTTATLSEVEAIGALLERLPLATPAEVLELGRSCPHRHVANHADRLHTRLAAVSGERPADRWMADLEKLRTRLAGLITTAHEQAAAAEAWLCDLEQAVVPDDPEPPATLRQTTEPSPPSPAAAPARPRGRRDATGPVSSNESARPPVRRRDQRQIGSTQPNSDDQALVRRLCHRMAASPAEADELIAMLGVVG